MDHKLLMIIANQPTPEKEAEYNRWYNETHIPLLLKYRGVKKVSRYRRTSENKDCSPYLAVYEFDNKEDLAGFTKSPEFAAAIVDFNEKWKDGGFERKWSVSYELIKTWDK